jgi:hypothetical protein
MRFGVLTNTLMSVFLLFSAIFLPGWLAGLAAHTHIYTTHAATFCNLNSLFHIGWLPTIAEFVKLASTNSVSVCLL